MAHITAKRRGGDSLENVKTLCAQCHHLEHVFGPSMTKPVPAKPKPELVRNGETQQ
jgi:5-methylcytosine-specific restriction endonuclease McrA